MRSLLEPDQKLEPAKGRAAQARFFRFNGGGGHSMTRAEPSAPSSGRLTRECWTLARQLHFAFAFAFSGGRFENGTCWTEFSVHTYCHVPPGRLFQLRAVQ